MGVTHLSGFGAQKADWREKGWAGSFRSSASPWKRGLTANAQSQVPSRGSEHTEGTCGGPCRRRVGVGLCGRVIGL